MPKASWFLACSSRGHSRLWMMATGAQMRGVGKVYVDAVKSVGVFEVPAGSRIDAGGHSYYVAEVKRCGDFNGHVRHWELTVR